MPALPVHSLKLTCHRDAPGAAVRGVAVSLTRRREGVLAVSYVIAGDLDRLRLPARSPPRIAERLWQHTCCEIFVALADLPGYHEFNFSPSGEWAAYAFARYREGSPLAREELDPEIAVCSTAEELELDAVIRLDRLSPLHCSARLALGVSAVIEERDGRVSYWALRHPHGKPDFHHAQAFALELDEVRH
jgi:hypothetical protein